MDNVGFDLQKHQSNLNLIKNVEVEVGSKMDSFLKAKKELDRANRAGTIVYRENASQDERNELIRLAKQTNCPDHLINKLENISKSLEETFDNELLFAYRKAAQDTINHIKNVNNENIKKSKKSSFINNIVQKLI